MNFFIASDNWTYDEQNVWFIGIYDHAIFRYSIENHETRMISRIPYTDLPAFRPFWGCVRYDKKIFLIPYYYNYICVYDLKKETWERIFEFHEKNVLCYRWIQVENRIYSFSLSLKKIVMLDMLTNEIRQISILDSIDESVRLFYGNDKMYLYGNVSKQVYCFICQDESLTKLADDISEEVYSFHCTNNARYYMSKKQKIIIHRNSRKEIISLGDLNIREYNKGVLQPCMDSFTNVPFFEHIETNRFFWLIPLMTNKIFLINKANDEIKEFKVKSEYLHQDDDILQGDLKHPYLVLYHDKEKITLFDNKTMSVFEIYDNSLSFSALKNRIGEECYLNRVLHENMTYDKWLFEVALTHNAGEFTHGNIDCYTSI